MFSKNYKRCNCEGGLILRNLLLIQGVGFVKGMIHSFISWFLPILVMNRLGSIAFSLVFTMRFVMFFAHLLGGYLADLSRKWTLALSDALLISFLVCLLLLHSSAVGLLFLVFLWYFYYALPTAAAQLLRMESVPSGWRGKILTIAPALATASYAVGSVVFGYIYTVHGLTLLLQVMLVLAFIALISRIFLIETVHRKRGRSEYFREVFSLIKDRSYIWFVITALFIGMALNAKVFLSPYMKNVLKLNIMTIATLYALFEVVSAVGSIYLGHVLDVHRHEIPRIFALYLLTDGIVIALAMILSTMNPILISIIAVSEVISSTYFAAISLYVNERYENVKGIALMSARALVDLAAFTRPITGLLWIYSPQLAIILTTTTIPLIVAATILRTKIK